MRLILLGRQGCHLCDEAAAMLASLGHRFGLEITGIDIDHDDQLVKDYGLRIPVILDEGGRILAEGVIDRDSLEAVLGDVGSAQ